MVALVGVFTTKELAYIGVEKYLEYLISDAKNTKIRNN